MFGWNALALALKGQDIYATGCAAEREGMGLPHNYMHVVKL